MNILFVCTGNTCRSPMAAALMNKLASENDMDVTCESAGIYASENEPASENAIIAMQNYGADLTEHKSKIISDTLIQQSDLILTMTEGHKMMISGIAPEKIFTICEFAGYEGDISDPYGGDIDEYKETAEEIYDCLTEILEAIYDVMGDSE